MKFSLSLLVGLIIISPLAAQPKFVPGFLINQAGERISCLIEIPDREYSPEAFRYRFTDDAPPLSGTLDQVQAFGIAGKSLFQRATVEVESSPRLVDQLSNYPTLQKTSKEVFLETLIEAEISLLRYREFGVENFYLKPAGELPFLLPYKPYREDGKLKENAPFRQMLHANYACPHTDPAEMAQLAYKENALVNHIKCYLKSQDLSFTHLQDRPESNLNLSIRPGIRFAQFQINYDTPSWAERRQYRKRPVVAAIGFEFEWLPPLKGQRWSFILEPTLHSTQITSTAETEYWDYEITATYRSLETLAGVRYYHFLTEELQLFANAGMGIDFFFGSGYVETGGSLPIERDIRWGSENYFGGFGINYKQQFSFESRFAFGKDPFSSFYFWSSQYNYFTAILGVRVF